MKIKTRLDILTDIEYELCVRLPIQKFPSDTNFTDRWVSVDSIKGEIYDLYRKMCNKYGKAVIWEMNADELIEQVELYLQEKLGECK